MVLLVVAVVSIEPSSQTDDPPRDPATEENRGPPHTLMIDVFGMMPADVYRDGKRLGTTPYSLQTWVGEHVELTLRREGYYDKTLNFDVTATTRSIDETLQRKP